MERIAVFAALRWECTPLLRSLRGVRRERLGELTMWRATAVEREMWLIKTGMGQERAAAAADAVCQSGHFDAFLSTGCAGALAPNLGPGDLTVATTVIGSATGQSFATDAAYSRRVCMAAERAALHATLGPMLSTSAVIANPAAKQAAATATGALVVEMEGAAIGACALAAGIPFSAVRAVLDNSTTELHGAGAFVDPQTGAVRPWGLVRHLARQPSAIGQLLELQRMMAAAQQSLERFFAMLVSQH